MVVIGGRGTIADEVGEMLVQRAAEGNVEDLMSRQIAGAGVQGDGGAPRARSTASCS